MPFAFALQCTPTAGAVVGNYLLEHGCEGKCVDRFILTDGHGAGRLIIAPGSDDALRIGDDGTVVEKYVDMVPRGQQGADVALQDEVWTVVRLMVSVTPWSAAWISSRTSWQIVCCQLGRDSM